MKSKKIILSIVAVVALLFMAVAGFIVGRTLIFKQNEMILCSGVTLIDNVEDENCLNYHGFYLHFPVAEYVIEERLDEVEAICTGEFEEAFQFNGDNTWYIVFKEKDGSRTAIVIDNTDVILCQDVHYAIRYIKDTKGDAGYFDYDKNSAKHLVYAISEADPEDIYMQTIMMKMFCWILARWVQCQYSLMLVEIV